MNFIQFSEFPNSFHQPFTITSEQTSIYNCIAWAFGDNSRWFWPDPENIYYWPDGISREITINAFIELYSLIGYEVCENGKIVRDVEKIAIFADDKGLPTHAARQLPDGNWTSKLGQHIDISHSIYSIEGGAYGHVAIYMQRALEV